MALQATFIADFASFYDAVQKAELQLKSFDTGVGKVESSLNRMVDQFSGRKIIQEATLMAEAIERSGGVSSLTASELARVGARAAEAAEKMQLMGIQVPERLQAIAAAATSAKPSLDALSVAAGQVLADAAVAGARAVKEIATESAATAIRAESLASVARFLGAQSGYTAGEVDSLVDALKRQGITTTQSYDTVIQMTRGNLSLADATKLATSAQSLARASNENSSATLGRLIQSVQTLDTSQLKAIGVVVQLEKENAKFAATQGRTAESLSMTERQQVALSAIFREAERVAGVYGVTAENVGGQLKSMERHQEEAARALGEVFMPAVRLGTDALTGLYQLVQKAPTEFAILGTGVAAAAGYVTTLGAASKLGLISTTALTSGLGLLAPAAATAGSAFVGWELGRWIGETTGATDAVERLAGWVQGLTKEQIESTIATRKFNESEAGRQFRLELSQKAMQELIRKAQEKADADAKAAAEEVRLAKVREETIAATKRYDAAWKNLMSTGDGWRGTLATMKEEEVAAIARYYQAGNSQGDLAIAFKKTEAQIKAVVTMLGEEKKAHDAAADAADKAARIKAQAVQQTSKLWNEYHALLAERSGTATDKQIADVQRWAADVADQARRAGTWNLEMMVALESTTRAKLDNMKVDWSALRDYSRLTLEDTAEKARATYEAMLGRSNEFTLSTLENFRRQAEAAEEAALNWNNSYSTTIDAISAKSSEGASRIMRDAEAAALSWSDAMDKVRQGLGTMTGAVQQGFTYGSGAAFQPIKSDTLGPLLGTTMPGFPSFATGVTNFQGGIAKVHKDELLVNLPKGTDVIPAISPYGPGRGGTTITNHFHITAGMGANGQEIARVVKQALAEDAAREGRRVGVW